MTGPVEPRPKRGVLGCLAVLLVAFVWASIPEPYVYWFEDVLAVIFFGTAISLVVLLMGGGVLTLFGMMFLETVVFHRARRHGWPAGRTDDVPWIMSWPKGFVWGQAGRGAPILALFAFLPRRVWRRLPPREEVSSTPLLNVPNPTESLIRTLILLWSLDQEWSPAEHARTPRLLKWRLEAWERSLRESPSGPPEAVLEKWRAAGLRRKVPKPKE